MEPAVDPCLGVERDLENLLEDAQPTGYSGFDSQEITDEQIDALMNPAFGEDQEDFPETQKQPSFEYPAKEAASARGPSNAAGALAAANPVMLQEEPTTHHDVLTAEEASKHHPMLTAEKPPEAPLEEASKHHLLLTAEKPPQAPVEEASTHQPVLTAEKPAQAPVEEASKQHPMLTAEKPPQALLETSTMQPVALTAPEMPVQAIVGEPGMQHVKTDGGKAASQEPPTSLDEHLVDDLPEIAGPPPMPSQKAIEARVRRLTKPRADGSYKLPDMFMEQWKDLESGRNALMHLFEKCNFEIDRGLKSTFFLLIAAKP